MKTFVFVRPPDSLDHCFYCNDTGRFREKDDKNLRHAVGYIPCPHCINGKYRMSESRPSPPIFGG